MAEIYRGRVTGPSYDQGSTLKALNFYEDYLILYESPPSINKYRLLNTKPSRLRLGEKM